MINLPVSDGVDGSLNEVFLQRYHWTVVDVELDKLIESYVVLHLTRHDKLFVAYLLTGIH